MLSSVPASPGGVAVGARGAAVACPCFLLLLYLPFLKQELLLPLILRPLLLL